MLAGCRAHVTDVVPIDAGGPPPVEILVDVAAASTIASEQAEPARKVSAKIESELIQRLAEAKITAEPFVPGAGRPGAAVLHVSIVKADPGNAAERFVVGFGLGRAELQANVDLESGDAADAHSMVGFHTSGDSGRKPGMILPGGVALATRDATHLAIGGGIKIATSSNDGIDVPAKRTAAAVVDQLEKYYASVGWTWPGGDRPWWRAMQ